jgi:hypothetical protein
MATLRGHTPDMVRQEAYAHLIAHNLIRGVMTQAATAHGVGLDRISFKGALDAIRQFTQALAQARSKGKRQELWAELLQTLAIDLEPAHLRGEKARFDLAGCGFSRLTSSPSSANHPLELDGHDAIAQKYQHCL